MLGSPVGGGRLRGAVLSVHPLMYMQSITSHIIHPKNHLSSLLSLMNMLKSTYAPSTMS